MEQIQKVLKKVKKLEYKTKNQTDSLFFGEYKSVFKGRGLDFTDISQYNYSDDFKNIDWKTTARLGEPYVKKYTEERDLFLYLLIDISGSLEYGKETKKKQAVLEIAASLMFSALKNNDNVGLLLATDKVERFLKAKKGKKHILRLLREIIYFKPKSKKTALANAIRFMSKTIKTKSMVFILSDFLDSNFNKELKILKARNDIIAVQVLDENEIKIPDIGLIEIEDPESHEQILVNTSDRQFRENYSKEISKKLNSSKKDFSKLNIDLIRINTAKPFEAEFKKFFEKRKKLRAW